MVYKIKTEFTNAISVFSSDDQYVIMLGNDSRIRYLEWSVNEKKLKVKQKLQEEFLNDVLASPDGKLLVTLSKN